MKTALLALMFLGSTAHAYVPPSSFIVKKIVSKRADLKGLRVRLNVSSAQDPKADGPHFKENLLFDPETRTLRSQAFDDGGKLLYSAERTLPVALGGMLQLDTSVDSLTKALKQADIPIKTESELLELPTETARYQAESVFLNRNKGVVAWVVSNVNNKKKENVTPQLWVEKDSFLPVKLVWSVDGGLVDLSFEGFKFTKEIPFARTVIASKAGKEAEIIFRADLVEVLVNPNLSEMKKDFAGGFSEAGNSLEDSTRELILRYYQLMR